jgi:DnaJ-class molecular chaperone
MTTCGVCKGAGAIKGTVGAKRIKKLLTCLACNGTGVQQWAYQARDESQVHWDAAGPYRKVIAWDVDTKGITA